METGSNQHDKDSRSPDAFPSGELMEPVVRMSVDRVYPPGMGLRPKACPRSRNATSTTTWSERPIQGPVDRCLTLVRAMTPEVPDDSGVESWRTDGCSCGCSGIALPLTPGGLGRRPRPGQSANRDRTQSWWDVLACCAQMWDAVSHVRCSLQSYLG